MELATKDTIEIQKHSETPTPIQDQPQQVFKVNKTPQSCLSCGKKGHSRRDCRFYNVTNAASGVILQLFVTLYPVIKRTQFKVLVMLIASKKSNGKGEIPLIKSLIFLACKFSSVKLMLTPQ